MRLFREVGEPTLLLSRSPVVSANLWPWLCRIARTELKNINIITGKLRLHIDVLDEYVTDEDTMGEETKSTNRDINWSVEQRDASQGYRFTAVVEPGFGFRVLVQRMTDEVPAESGIKESIDPLSLSHFSLCPCLSPSGLSLHVCT